MRPTGPSKEVVSRLLFLLDELEGQLDANPDPDLAELRSTVGAALAALYRFNAEDRLARPAGPPPSTRQ